MWNTILSGEIWEGDIKNRAKDGSFYWVKSTIVPFCNENNLPYMFVALRTDITKGKESEEQLVRALKNEFNSVVSTMHNFVFKVTRDDDGRFIYQFGEGKLAHQLGLDTPNVYQKTPKEVFPRELVDVIEENYQKSYMGQTVTYNYSLKCRHVLTTLSPIYENGKITYLIGCGNDVSDLNRAKEEVEFLAYHDSLTNLPNRNSAKGMGKNGYKIYDQPMKHANQKYLHIETFLRTAIENEELKLVFQPKLNIKENKINGMEALLRWSNPILGDIPPNEFIPIAEETGIMWQIDEWVLKSACLQNKKWNELEQVYPLRIAVNISAIQFSHPDFVKMVKTSTAKYI